jgi:RNA recognition motif-containing protein
MKRYFEFYVNSQYPKKRPSSVAESSMRTDSVNNSGSSGLKNIVLVCNLDPKVDDTTWKLLFKEYGPIIRYWRNPNGKECLVKVGLLIL